MWVNKPAEVEYTQYILINFHDFGLTVPVLKCRQYSSSSCSSSSSSCYGSSSSCSGSSSRCSSTVVTAAVVIVGLTTRDWSCCSTHTRNSRGCSCCSINISCSSSSSGCFCTVDSSAVLSVIPLIRNASPSTTLYSSSKNRPDHWRYHSSSCS